MKPVTISGTPVTVAGSAGGTTTFTFDNPGFGVVAGVRVDLVTEDEGTRAEMCAASGPMCLLEVAGDRQGSFHPGEYFPVETPCDGESKTVVKVVHANHNGAISSVILCSVTFVIDGP